MKRIFALILAVALMLCTFTSCGNGSGTDNNKVSGPSDLEA